MQMTKPTERKSTAVRIDRDLVPWLDFASSVDAISVNAYINQLIRQDKDECDSGRIESFERWIGERNRRTKR